MKILVTGGAGFIGSSVAKSLIDRGDEVVIVDNLNDYYDPELKNSRLEQLNKYNNFKFQKVDLKDKLQVDKIFETYQPTHVINLAAQAGVRYSVENPQAFINTNT